jgi:opacity protein-like surface antigen
MKKFLLVIFMIGSIISFAQINLGLTGGYVHSSFKTDPGIIDFKWKSGLTVGVQGEFFRNSNLTLVVDLAYIQKGAKSEWENTTEDNPEGDGTIRTIYHNYDYFSLNLLAKYRVPINNWAPFGFAGLRADSFLTKSRSTFSEPDSQYITNMLNLGFTAGLGLEYNLTNWCLFFRTSFQNDFTPTIENIPGNFEFTWTNKAILIDLGCTVRL